MSDEAFDVLADVESWQLTPDRWEQVAGSLRRMARALAAGDSEALADALAEVQDTAGSRIVRIGSRPPTGVPDQVLDLRNELVHSLGRRRSGVERPDAR